MKDNKLILYKSITWRILAVLSSFLLGLLFGIGIGKSILLTIILNAINACAYALHEKLWLRYLKKF